MPRKLVVRHIPAGLSESLFWETLGVYVEHAVYKNFISGHLSRKSRTKPPTFATAFIAFDSEQEADLFQRTFSTHVFMDGKGTRYPILIENAPNQRLPINQEPLNLGIESDASFLEFLNREPEVVSEQVVSKDQVTPLLESLRKLKKEEPKKKKKRRNKKKV